MTTKPETNLKKRVRSNLEALPSSHWFKIQQVVILGTPDILGCYKGTFVAIELKDGDEKPTELQIYNLQMILKAKGLSFVMNQSNFQEIIFALLNDSNTLLRKKSIDNVNSFL